MMGCVPGELHGLFSNSVVVPSVLTLRIALQVYGHNSIFGVRAAGVALLLSVASGRRLTYGVRVNSIMLMEMGVNWESGYLI